MRLASFRLDDAIRPGAVIGDEIVDLRAAAPDLPGTVAELLAAGDTVRDRIERAIAAGSHRVALFEVELVAPVRPQKFLAVGLNYADHVAETGLTPPEFPTVFAKLPSCVVGPYADVERPIASDQLDYEGELGIVIGRRCRHVSRAEAASVIGGYVVVNDVSVRDWQKFTPQWTLGKSFDTHGPIGPWVVTPDELGDPHALDLRTYVNGDLRQSSNTANLIHDCFRQVEILSTVCTLEPGDVIATGTPGGVGGAMRPQQWLVPGDVVRVEIDGVGVIENRVVDERPASGGGRPGPAPVSS